MAVPRVSVVIPTHNRACLVKEAIQSVLDQTCTDREIIVVDDGSTDDTADVVSSFGSAVSYIFQTCQGPGEARNTGFRHSRGRYVSFLDSDDFMLPHNLDTLAGILDERPEVGLAYGWYAFTDEAWAATPRGGPRLKDEKPLEWRGFLLAACGSVVEGRVLPQILLEETMLAGTNVIRREWIEAIGGFRPRPHQEHWDFYVRLAAAGCVYACCRQVVTVLRLHPGNRGQDLDAMIAARREILDEHLRAPALPPDLTAIAARAYYAASMEGALLSYADGWGDSARRHLREALGHAPLDPADADPLAYRVTQFALSAGTDSVLRTVREQFAALPGGAEIVEVEREALRRVARELAAREYARSGLSLRTFLLALQAFAHDRSMLAVAARWAGRRLHRILGTGRPLPT